jgi:hypothetical protein
MGVRAASTGCRGRDRAGRSGIENPFDGGLSGENGPAGMSHRRAKLTTIMARWFVGCIQRDDI